MAAFGLIQVLLTHFLWRLYGIVRDLPPASSTRRSPRRTARVALLANAALGMVFIAFALLV